MYTGSTSIIREKKLWGWIVGEGNIGLRVVKEKGKQYQNILHKILKDTFKNTNKIKLLFKLGEREGERERSNKKVNNQN